MTTDALILRTLRQADDEGIAAAELARAAGITEGQLRGRIMELRGLGYDIAVTPHLGYHLLDSPDSLHADDLVARLGATRVIGRDIQVFHETTSTNDVAERLARDGVPEGAVVFAEAQTRGRGRMGRRWLSPPGQGLWFSVLLRPPLAPQSATQLTVISATATARAIREVTGLAPQIKWPNDILLDGKKVVGILTELSAELDQVKHVILGIGVDVNVTEFPAELREIATSLAIVLGTPVSRGDLATAILRELDRDYARVCHGDFTALAEEWEQQCVTLGRRVRIQTGGHEVSGLAESLDNDGALLVRTGHGRLERIIGGDVTIEKG